MTDNTKKFLEQRSTLIKFFDKFGQKESDNFNVLQNSAECARDSRS